MPLLHVRLSASSRARAWTYALIFAIVVIECLVLTRLKQKPLDAGCIALWAANYILLALAVRGDKLANLNAIWCALSALLVTAWSAYALGEWPTKGGVLGIALVVAGVAIIDSQPNRN